MTQTTQALEASIDKLLNDLDDLALSFGDDIPGLALNSRGYGRSRAVVRAFLSSTAPSAAEPSGLSKAVEDFLHAYRSKYGNSGKAGVRANAPLLEQVTLLNAAFRAAPPAPQVASEPVAWLPTAENINALPEPVRDYIHALIANCDPAGNVADNTIKADTIRALEASNRRIRDELDTPGNRNPEARYAGYRGELALERYTADELAAWEEGQRARVPASVAGLSGDAEREALTDKQIDVLLRKEFGGHYDASDEVATRLRNILRQACRVVVSALHSTGKPDESKDAERRYRWLKSKSREVGMSGGWEGRFELPYLPAWDDTPYSAARGKAFNCRGNLDAAIDAAMEQEERS